MPGYYQRRNGRRIAEQIAKKKLIKIYKSMNPEDVKHRMELDRELQNTDYQLKVLDQMRRSIATQPYAHLQLSCFGAFLRIDDENLDIIIQTTMAKRQRIIDDLKAAR